MSASFAPSLPRRIPRWLLAIAAAGLLGCQQSEPTPPPAPVAEPTPQDRFDRIVESLRKDLDGSSFALSDTTGTVRGASSYTVEASPKIRAPEEEGDSYRGTIKVTLKTSILSMRTKPEENEDEEPKEDSHKASSQDDSLNDSGADVLDSELVPDLPEEFSTPEIDSLNIGTRTISGDNATVYELEYHKKRWTLATPPKLDAPESANIAIKRAIRRQG